MDPRERILLSPTFGRKHSKIHYEKPIVIKLENPPKGFFSKTINREDLKFGAPRITELLCYWFKKTDPSLDPQPRAISTGSDLGRSPYELAGEIQMRSCYIWS